MYIMATWYYPLKVWNAETNEPISEIEVQWQEPVNEVSETNKKGVAVIPASPADPDMLFVRIGGEDGEGNNYDYDEFEVRKVTIENNYTEVFLHKAEFSFNDDGLDHNDNPGGVIEDKPIVNPKPVDDTQIINNDSKPKKNNIVKYFFIGAAVILIIGIIVAVL